MRFNHYKAIFLFCALLAGQAFAQNGKTGANTSQAVLTVHVNVVPMIELTQPTSMIQSNATIAYNIPLKSTHKTVIQESQEEIVTDGSGNSQRSFVAITTVVVE